MGKLEKTYGLIRAENNKGRNTWSETGHVMNLTFLKKMVVQSLSLNVNEPIQKVGRWNEGY